MTTQSVPAWRRPTLVAPLTAMMLLLTGCSGNLFSKVTNFWSLGCCGTVAVVLDIVALIELVDSDKSTGSKLIWAGLIIIFPYLGCVLYYLFGR